MECLRVGGLVLFSRGYECLSVDAHEIISDASVHNILQPSRVKLIKCPLVSTVLSVRPRYYVSGASSHLLLTGCNSKQSAEVTGQHIGPGSIPCVEIIFYVTITAGICFGLII